MRRGNLILFPRRLLRRKAPRNDPLSMIATLPPVARNDKVTIIIAFVLVIFDCLKYIKENEMSKNFVGRWGPVPVSKAL